MTFAEPTKLIGGACELCGEPVDGLAGDPGKWPLRFPKPDGTGISRPHHMRCVIERVYPPSVEQEHRLVCGRCNGTGRDLYGADENCPDRGGG